jgi:hypothetical protein
MSPPNPLYSYLEDEMDPALLVVCVPHGSTWITTEDCHSRFSTDRDEEGRFKAVIEWTHFLNKKLDSSGAFRLTREKFQEFFKKYFPNSESFYGIPSTFSGIGETTPWQKNSSVFDLLGAATTTSEPTAAPVAPIDQIEPFEIDFGADIPLSDSDEEEEEGVHQVPYGKREAEEEKEKEGEEEGDRLLYSPDLCFDSDGEVNFDEILSDSFLYHNNNKFIFD